MDDRTTRPVFRRRVREETLEVNGVKVKIFRCKLRRQLHVEIIDAEVKVVPVKDRPVSVKICQP
jgi:hypothetical protein